jgi:hypothetical protein
LAEASGAATLFLVRLARVRGGWVGTTTEPWGRPGGRPRLEGTPDSDEPVTAGYLRDYPVVLNRFLSPTTTSLPFHPRSAERRHGPSLEPILLAWASPVASAQRRSTSAEASGAATPFPVRLVRVQLAGLAQLPSPGATLAAVPGWRARPIPTSP